MDERINTGYEFPKKTQEQARRSQAHWWGIDPDEWWAKCQEDEEADEPEDKEASWTRINDNTILGWRPGFYPHKPSNVEHGVCDGTGFTDQEIEI